MGKNKVSKKGYVLLDSISFYTLLTVLFLVPIFFIPSLQISLEVGKGFLLSLGVCTSFFLWLLARIVEGKFYFPKQAILLAGLSVPVALLISAVFSPSFAGSMSGGGFELSTVSSALVMFLVMFLSSVFFQTKQRMFLGLAAIGGAFVLVGIFHIVDLIFHLTVHFPHFFAQVSGGTVLGSWNDLAIFSGLVLITGLMSSETLSLDKKQKWILCAVIAVALFFMAISNFFMAWLVAGLFALFIFIYSLSFAKDEKSTVSNRFPTTSFVVVLICLVFVLANGFFGSYLSLKLGTYSSEVRPSVMATANIAKHVFLKRSIVGIGPNRFSEAWDLYKPADVNTTGFWNSSFDTGFGLLPSFAVTAGLIGLLAWLALLGIFLVKGFGSMFSSSADKVSSYLFSVSFLGAVYLWIVALLYVPNISSFVFAFMLTGVCVASWTMRKGKTVSVSLVGDPRVSFFSILISVSLLIGVVAGAYIFIKQFASLYFFEKAAYASYGTQAEIIDNAEANLNRAISLRPTDLYYRSLSQVYVAKFNALIGQNNLSSEAIKPELQTAVQNAESAGRMAVQHDKKNYTNWRTLAGVYESFVPVGIQGAYSNAVSSFNEAIALNPKDPSLYLSLANLELSQKNIDKATVYKDQALALKGNYSDALLLFGRYYDSVGNASAALDQYKQAVIIDPLSVTAFSDLGLYYYGHGSYGDAVGPFERAVILDPTNANTRYYLGMAYAKAGRTADAISQLQYVLAQNPGNKQIQDLISGLQNKPTAAVSTEQTQIPTPAPTKKPIVPVKKK